ncbi:MAG: hypothetical protein K8R87_13450 [Verrucomicrobia bacterium]|nr:hypothetical protein [Verrucomicrobiota bacterium]
MMMNQVRAVYALLFLTLGGMGAWVWKLNEKQALIEQELRKAETSKAVALALKEKDFEDARAADEAKHQEDLRKLNTEFESKLEDFRKKERVKLAQAYEQFSGILDGDKKTLEYLNLIEQKVKSGAALSGAEAEKLAVIATGLTYLQKQYTKPFEEFSELEAYLQKRASTQIDTPNMRNSFWKRMFSREFREQEREFYRTEGERRGFQDAQGKFSEAYAAAQKRMAGVNLEMDKTIEKLNDVIQEKPTSMPDLADFFNQARKALNAHQKLLEFEPDLTKPLNESVRP